VQTPVCIFGLLPLQYLPPFAAILADGSVGAWGDPGYGGDGSAVQDQLKDVQQIQATDAAFAAISADGTVGTWGLPNDGGDSMSLEKGKSANGFYENS
jgi:hypothetical protein